MGVATSARLSGSLYLVSAASGFVFLSNQDQCGRQVRADDSWRRRRRRSQVLGSPGRQRRARGEGEFNKLGLWGRVGRH